MILMNPVHDHNSVVSPEIKILKPHKIASVLSPVNNSFNICNPGEDWRNKASSLYSCFIKLLHCIQSLFYGCTTIHLFSKFLIDCPRVSLEGWHERQGSGGVADTLLDGSLQTVIICQSDIQPPLYRREAV